MISDAYDTAGVGPGTPPRRTGPHAAAVIRRPDAPQHRSRTIALPEDTALVLIDFQRGFAPSLWPYWSAPGAMRNNPDAEQVGARLLAAWRVRGMRVMHVRHDSMSPTSPLSARKSTNEFHPLVQPRGGEGVYRKHVSSAFIGTSLESDLRAARVRTLVIAGLTTDHCVSTNARMAADLGFTTFVVSDATATFDREGPDGRLLPADTIHRAALASLHDEFAIVTTAEITLAGLAREVLAG